MFFHLPIDCNMAETVMREQDKTAVESLHRYMQRQRWAQGSALKLNDMIEKWQAEMAIYSMKTISINYLGFILMSPYLPSCRISNGP